MIVRSIGLVFTREWRHFVQSDRSLFAIYLLLVLFWSVFLVSNILTGNDPYAHSIGLIFFAVIIGGNFSNATFTSERLSGSMEVLLTSGLARGEILTGKLFFVMAITLGLGAVCYGLSNLWLMIFATDVAYRLSWPAVLNHLELYASACFMNATCGAWLSLRLANPRMSYFVNFLICGVVAATYFGIAALTNSADWGLSLLLVILGLVMLNAARRGFASEKVIQPVNL
jgi:ABC-type Na+ efflux pump permease subunit